MSKERREAIRHAIRTVRGAGRGAGRGDWNLSDHSSDGEMVGTQHPGSAAILAVRAVFADYRLPTPIDLSFSRVQRKVGHGAHAMSEGIVWVLARTAAVSGPRFEFEIPVEIHSGRLLSPGVLYHQQTPYVISQNAFDEILRTGEFRQKVPDRAHMFAVPGDNWRDKRSDVPRISGGMFKVPWRRTIASVRRGFWHPDVTGLRQDGEENRTPGVDRSHLDPAERPLEGLAPHQAVKTTREVEVHDRGGGLYRIPSGEKGSVVRDMDGTDFAYYVSFPDLGYSAVVARDALK